MASENTDTPDNLIGQIIDHKYEIVAKIGAGASSCVYKANDILLGRLLAIKVLHKHLLEKEATKERFLGEAAALASINHASIVKVYSRGTLDNGQLYLVMDFIEGAELSEYLAREKTLATNVFFSVFSQLLDALEEAHKNGIVHRDIKPSNIMLVTEDGEQKAILLDFGIAKSLSPNDTQQNLTATRMQLGTSAYMSPEQCRASKIDERSDLYSLTCVMYECLVGQQLFEGASDMDVMYQQLNKHITQSARLKNLSPDFKKFLIKALHKAPEERFQTASLMKEALLASRYLVKKQSYSISFALVAAVLIVTLAGLTAYKFSVKEKEHEANSSEESRRVSRIRTCFDLDNFLKTNPRDLNYKISIGKMWLQQHKMAIKTTKREIGLAEESLAKALSQNGEKLAAHDMAKQALSDNDHLKPEEEVVLRCQTAHYLDELGEYDRALKECETALSLARKQGQFAQAKCLSEMLNCCFNAGYSDKAKSVLQDFRRLNEINEQSDPEDYFRVQTLYGQLLYKEKKLREAEAVARETLISFKNSTYNSTNFAWVKYQNLLTRADCAAGLGQFAEAEKLYLEVIANNREEILPSIELAKIYDCQGKTDKARAIRERLKTGVSPTAGLNLFLVARIPAADKLVATGHYAEARSAYTSIINEWCAHGTANDWGVDGFRDYYCGCLQKLFKLYEQSKQLDDLISYTDKLINSLPPTSLEQATLYALKGQAELTLKKLDLGKSDFQRAIDSIKGSNSTAKLIRVNLQSRLALGLIENAKPVEASSVAEQAWQELTKYPFRKFELAQVQQAKSRIAAFQKQYPQAIEALKEQIRYLTEISPNSESEISNLRMELAYLYLKSDQKVEAAIEFEKAARILASSRSAKDNNEGQALCWSEAGEVYLGLNDLKKAKDCRKKVLACLQLTDPGKKPGAETDQYISKYLQDMGKQPD